MKPGIKTQKEPESRMAKCADSDAVKLRIVSEEVARFNRLFDGHRKLLEAVGRL